MELTDSQLFMQKYIDQHDNISIVVGVKGICDNGNPIGIMIKLVEGDFFSLVERLEKQVPTYHPSQE